MKTQTHQNQVEKQHLFDQFMFQHGERYNQVKMIAGLLEAKPELCFLFDSFEPARPDQLDDLLGEYLWRVHQISNPVDRVFFKLCWVPVSQDGMSFYIDTSKSKFQLFSVEYFFFEPYCWFKRVVVNDIRVLLHAESPSDLGRALWNYRRSFEMESDRCFLNRYLAGLKGQVKPEPMKMTMMRERSKPTFWTTTDHSLRVMGILPGILALLPSELPVTIHALKCDYQHSGVLMATATTVSGFCSLIQMLSASRIYSYTLLFKDGSGNASYDRANGTGLFELNCTRDEVTNHVLKLLLKRFAP